MTFLSWEVQHDIINDYMEAKVIKPISAVSSYNYRSCFAAHSGVYNCHCGQHPPPHHWPLHCCCTPSQVLWLLAHKEPATLCNYHHLMAALHHMESVATYSEILRSISRSSSCWLCVAQLHPCLWLLRTPSHANSLAEYCCGADNIQARAKETRTTDNISQWAGMFVLRWVKCDILSHTCHPFGHIFI